MSTFADLKSRIASEIHRTDVTDEIDLAVLSAVKHYEPQRFWFNESSSTFSTVAGQAEYTSATVLNSVSTSLMELDLVTISVNGRSMEIKPAPWQMLASVDQTGWTGEPSRYGWRAEKMRLYPIPNAIYTITAYGLIGFEELSDDADTNAWTNEAKDLIRHRAKVELYESVLISPQRADRERGLEAETLRNMQRRTYEMSATNQLVGDM